MLLFFRFFITILRSRFRPRIGPLGESRVRFTALPGDCDLNLHLNAGRYLSFMDVARVELIGRMRLFVRMILRGWRPVIGGATIRYRRSVLPFERFEIRSRLVGWDAKWFYIEHIVETKGQFCAIAYARTLIRKRDGNVTPAEFLSLMNAAEIPSPPLPDFVARWRDAEDAQ